MLSSVIPPPFSSHFGILFVHGYPSSSPQCPLDLTETAVDDHEALLKSTKLVHLFVQIPEVLLLLASVPHFVGFIFKMSLIAASVDYDSEIPDSYLKNHHYRLCCCRAIRPELAGRRFSYLDIGGNLIDLRLAQSSGSSSLLKTPKFRIPTSSPA